MPLSKHSEHTQKGAQCLRLSAFTKSGLFSSSPSLPIIALGCGLLEVWKHTLGTVQVYIALQMLLEEGGCKNSPTVNPHSCRKHGAGINCTRTGFIGEVACTSLVFNFQFSFNCPFLGGFKDFHNSFQLAHHGANPTALPFLPSLTWVPWS